jgi:RNA polymerase sigma-70 factor, ECF subfamily
MPGSAVGRSCPTAPSREPTDCVMTDQETLQAADRNDVRASLAGDGDAYARLVRRYQDEAASWLWRFTHDPLMLEELVQETFVQAYLSLRTFRASGPFGAWLRQIATRAGYRFWKQRRQDAARHSGSPAEPEAATDDPVDARDRQWTIQDVMAQLSPRNRLVVQLRYLEDRSVAEVAELTGWSQAMVKVQSYRARKKLHKLLEHSGL